MPRPRRNTGSSLSPDQAHYVIERLIRARKITAADISDCLSDMGREISELEERLHRLRDVQGAQESAAEQPSAPVTSAARGPRQARRGRRKGTNAGAPAPKAAGRKGRKSRKARGAAAVTPERAASRALQGRYIAMVRRFPAARRKRFAKIAKAEGREAAIRQMQSALK